MRTLRVVLPLLMLAAVRPALLLASGAGAGHVTRGDPRAGIAAFNRALGDATRHMDNAATLALWDDDGVSLLPSAKPLIGKRAIAAFLKDVAARFPGGRMLSFTNDCHDIEVSGTWASEWCVEHQVVLFPGGKRFDGWGKMLLVLHRGDDGRWRLHEEMWNQAVPPRAGAR